MSACDKSKAPVTLETGRLRLRPLRARDADFILDLLNQPSFLEHIGDKGVRDLDDAREYIRKGPAASHAEHGYGLDRVERKDTGEPIGICGLVRRVTLEHPDLGYAFLPAHWHRGFAIEAARGVLDDARNRLGLATILAIVSPDNATSIRLLEKLGFQRDATVVLEPGSSPVLRFTSG